MHTAGADDSAEAGAIRGVPTWRTPGRGRLRFQVVVEEARRNPSPHLLGRIWLASRGRAGFETSSGHGRRCSGEAQGRFGQVEVRPRRWLGGETAPARAAPGGEAALARTE